MMAGTMLPSSSAKREAFFSGLSMLTWPSSTNVDTTTVIDGLVVDCPCGGAGMLPWPPLGWLPWETYMLGSWRMTELSCCWSIGCNDPIKHRVSVGEMQSSLRQNSGRWESSWVISMVSMGIKPQESTFINASSYMS